MKVSVILKLMCSLYICWQDNSEELSVRDHYRESLVAESTRLMQDSSDVSLS